MPLFGPRITIFTKDGRSYTKQGTGRECIWDFEEQARRIRGVVDGIPISSAQFEEMISTCRDLDTQERADRPYLLETIDDAAVVQLYADGFEALSRGEKTLIWHLYQAALAGRDIYYDQRYEYNLEMREVLEEIVTHPNNVDPGT